MRTDFNLSWYNSSSVEIYVEPALKRHEESGFNISSLNFTWEVVKFSPEQLDLQLNFSEPIAISPLDIQDELVLRILDSSLFFSLQTQTELHESSRLMK